ncbi:MAG TPA: HAD family hydrolase [Lysobacter sp.]|nr:HAD family hydrolase [Lysobacter sp.]
MRRHLDASAVTAHAGGMSRCALFLDRDGVINEDLDYVHRIDQTHFLPGIFALCRAARDAGALVIVATNQAGIARGLYDEATYLAYTRWVHAQFAEQGAPLTATYYCPHHPDAGLGDWRIACDCRKPAPGMLRAAITEFGIDPARSIMLGDKRKDIEAAAAAGLRTAWLVGDEDAPSGTPRVQDPAAAVAGVALFFENPVRVPAP